MYQHPSHHLHHPDDVLVRNGGPHVLPVQQQGIEDNTSL